MKRVDFSIFVSFYKQRTPQIGLNPTCIKLRDFFDAWPEMATKVQTFQVWVKP